MEAVNFLFREQAGAVSDAIKEETAADQGQWKGITETEEPAIDHENEFIDDDRFTTVMVEAVAVSKDGLHKSKQEDEENSEVSGTTKSNGEPRAKPAGRRRVGPENAKRTWTKDPRNNVKRKKPKFRYESKAERKVTRHKERSRSRVKAKARRE